MARAQSEIRALAERIQALGEADRAKIIARVMIAERKKVSWSALQRIQHRVSESRLDGEKLDREIVEAVRDVRRPRVRRSRG